MALGPGTRIGGYEILTLLGSGGMGEVYRARDARLGRDVAIKILPADVAADHDRLARFEREAQVLASLNHPNIAHIFGVDDSTGAPALVMELVDGPTLADRIAKGPVPLDEALPIAKQIAEALEAAHDRGIIHRDLKPANIKVRDEGSVKVLDFGLAKAFDPAASAVGGATMSPTLSMHATQAGIILGTAAYMSPEQARGKAVDRRADIWAFGCVLYEMLTGRQTFAGDSVTDLLSSVTRDEPDWSALPAATPPAIRTLLRRCLQKDPQKRLPHIGVVRVEIDDGQPGLTPETPSTLSADIARRRSRWPWLSTLALLLVLGGAVALWAPWRPSTPSTPLTPMRFVIPLPGKGLAPTTIDRLLTISDDGTRVAFIAGDTLGGGQLMMRPIGQIEAVPVRGLSNVRQPFFSPDGRWIGFFEGVATAEMKKVPVDGGTPITICRLTSSPRGASWGPDDTIIFANADPKTGLFSVSAAGGEPTPLTTPDAAHDEADHVLPSFLPDGRAVLFTIAHNNGSASIALLDRTTGHYKTLVRDGRDAQYVPPGFLTYTANGSLHAARFDPTSLTMKGDGAVVDEQVLTAVGSGVAEYSVARNGTLVYVSGTTTLTPLHHVLVWVDRRGREQPFVAPERAYWTPRISPDGSRLAVEIRDQEQDIWIWDVARDVLTRLTASPLFDQAPVWSPDSKYVFYSSLRSGSVMNVHRQRADGSGMSERVFASANIQFPTSITPDGLQLLVTENSGSTVNDINLLMLAGTPHVEPLVHTSAIEMGGVLSPDGRWLAYTAVDATPDVYVRPFPNVNDARWQVSSGGGSQPAWTRNGHELIYRAGRAVMSVPVETSQGFSVRKAVKLFEADYLDSGAPVRNYDVSADGEKLVMIKNADTRNQGAVANLLVVVNWTAALESRLPAR
jgi:eukaryotic-like serine/threonine-protein kinase